MVKITLPDGEKKFEDGITLEDIAKNLGIKDAVAAKLNGKLVGISEKVGKDSSVQFFSFKSKEGKEVFWHSSAHILAAAVKRLYPEVKLAIGPPISEGFYYDFDGHIFSESEFEKIEKEMKKIIKEDNKFEKYVITKKEALEKYKNNRFKMDILDKEAEGGEVSIYKSGDFEDLCRGPHLTSTDKVGVIKILSVAGAYWRGDSKNPMLSRLYGIAFPSQEELDKFLKLKEEAEKRDHRKLGPQLDLFSFREDAPGFPFFHHKGLIIFNEIVSWWRTVHRKVGYEEVKAPNILSVNLWKQSGHWDHYKNDMFFTKSDEEEFAIRPMDCPGTILIFKSRPRSYKELPKRMAELGTVFRNELSGTLHGLLRVRQITQDDAHLFVTEDQILDEIAGILKLVDQTYKLYGLDYKIELSTRPESFLGDINIWNKAEEDLKKALEMNGKKYEINAGDGAFYGPKIDFKILDSLGREWQCATIQLDFQMPIKFDLEYQGPDDKLHRPVIIHRVIHGSIERFIGIITEHFAGAFPLWLSPVQVSVLTLTERNTGYANKVKEKLFDAGIRVEADFSNSTIQSKIRNAELEKIPYILVVGDKEEQNNTIAVRTRGGKVEYGVSLNKFLKDILEEITEKRLPIDFKNKM